MNTSYQDIYGIIRDIKCSKQFLELSKKRENMKITDFPQISGWPSLQRGGPIDPKLFMVALHMCFQKPYEFEDFPTMGAHTKDWTLFGAKNELLPFSFTILVIIKDEKV